MNETTSELVLILVSIIGTAFVSMIAYFGKRAVERRRADEKLERTGKTLEVVGQMKELGITPDILPELSQVFLNPEKFAETEKLSKIFPTGQQDSAVDSLQRIYQGQLIQAYSMLAFHSGNEAFYGEALQHLVGDKIPVSVDRAQFDFHSAMAMLRMFRGEDIPERELLEDYEKRIPKPPQLADYGIGQ